MVVLSEESLPLFCYDYVLPTAISTMCHPFITARTLMMLGHEYEPPKLGRTLLGLQRHMYPNVFSYLRCLREDVGLYQLFTVGLPASVIGGAIKTFACDKYLQKTVVGYLNKKSVIETEKGIDVFVEETCKLTVGRCLGIVLSYPFQVIMVRQIAQHVGKETLYSNLLQAFVEINLGEGLPGLFSGIIPRLLGEVIAVWLTAGCAYVVNQYLFPENADPKFKEQTPYVASLIVSACTHRLTVTSTVMAVSGSGLALAVPFKNSADCYSYLSRRGALGRGASFFFRYATGPL